MKIALGADHAGYEIKRQLSDYLKDFGFEIIDFGTDTSQSVDYPDFAKSVCKYVTEKKADYGILICGTGIGMEIAANKFKGIRAANCCTTEMAKLARQHNDANVLTMGARLLSLESMKEICGVFLNTDFDGGRHERRIGKIKDFEG